MSGKVTLHVEGAVGRIVIDRPEKHNAITPDMAAQLAGHCREVDARADVRVVTIAGAGERAFSAGSDLNALAGDPGVWAFRNRIEYATVVRDIRKPVIAALRGWVLGGGLEIALAADIRVAGRGAQLGAPEVKRGWLGGGGASQLLPRLVGIGQSALLLLSGEPVDAERALAIGLVEEVVEDELVAVRVDTLAQAIAAHSPIATQAVKAALRTALSAPLEAGLRYENELHVLCMQSQDRHEGIAAFQQRREGRFGGT